MKKLISSIIGVGLVMFAATALAIPLEAVGLVDILRFETNLSNSGEQTEAAWVNSVLGGGYDFSVKTETDEGDGWVAVDNMAGHFAHELLGSPSYYLIKVGGGDPITDDSNTHFLFENVASLDWAVIYLADMGFNNALNIRGVSHVSEFGGTPVPEPATMLLFGTGLAGLAGVARRKKAQK